MSLGGVRMGFLIFAVAIACTGVVAGILLYVGGRKAAACLAIGGSLGVLALASAAAWALSPDPGTNAGAVMLWCLHAALAGFVLLSARSDRLQAAGFALGLGECAMLAAFGVYVISSFKIF